MLLELTQLLLAPALTHPDEHRQDQLHETDLVPEMRNDFGPTPFLFKGPFRQVRRAPLLAMPRGHLQVMETGLRRVLQTPARLGKGVTRWRQQGRLTALTCLKLGASRMSAIKALKAGHACGGTCWGRFCIF